MPGHLTVPVERAFAGCLTALDEPGFAHLSGVGLRIDGATRVGGPEPGLPTDVFSITKAVLARGVLRAVTAGFFAGLDDPLVVTRRAGLTVRPRDLLWMTQCWTSEPDLDLLEQGPDDPLPAIVDVLAAGPGPGITSGYVNAASHLLIRELEHRTGSAHEFIAAAVLAPAGITGAVWESDQAGVPWGHAHLRLSVVELLRLGGHWLAEPLDAGLLGRPSPAMPPEQLPYAAGLWLGERYLLAAGWGGQCLLLVPQSGAVLAALGRTGWDRASNSDTLPPGWRSGRELFRRDLLPALLGRRG